MGDFQNQQVGAEQDDLQNRDAQSVAAEYPATAEVRSRIASGAPNASAIAKILHEHPKARNEIMALIHKTLGNGFAQQVAAENERIFRAEADDGPGIKEGKGAAVGSKNDPMSDFRDVNKTNRAMQPAVDGAELRANATDNAPLNTPLSGASTAAPDATSAAPAAGGMTKTRLELQEIEEYEAAMKTPGKQSDASTPAAPASFKSPSKAVTDDAAAEVFKDDPRRGTFNSDELRNIADGDGSALDKKPGKGEGAPTAAAPQVEEPQQASKVLKDETVIASSAEVKQPEIVRATEVLKDPNQGEEPQKASDVVKDDDAENEGSGGGAKADAGPVKITASVLRVRSSPKISKGNIVGRLTKDTVVEAIGHSGEWVEIKYKGQTAFVHSSFVVGAQETAIAKASDQVAPATAT